MSVCLKKLTVNALKAGAHLLNLMSNIGYTTH